MYSMLGVRYNNFTPNFFKKEKIWQKHLMYQNLENQLQNQ